MKRVLLDPADPVMLHLDHPGQCTWRRPDAEQYAELYVAYARNYRAVMESYDKTEEAAGQSKK